MGAWLYRARGRSNGELSRFLLTRGIWLVLLEVTIIHTAWHFELPFQGLVLLSSGYAIQFC